MAKIYPKGMGIWIAYGNMVPGGIPEIVRRCKELGVDWIAPRIGQGDYGFDQFFSEKRLREIAYVL